MQRTSVVFEKLLKSHQVLTCQEIDLRIMPLDSGNSFLPEVTFGSESDTALNN